MINFYNEDVKRPSISYSKLKIWITGIISDFSFKCGNISIIFCSDNYLLDYNRRFLKHNYFTDIITFNYNQNQIISGDLFLSVDTIKRNAFEYNVEENEEFKRVIIHGILHLIGFNDSTEEEITEMRNQELIALMKFNNLEL